jgi:hypothetical protein
MLAGVTQALVAQRRDRREHADRLPIRLTTTRHRAEATSPPPHPITRSPQFTTNGAGQALLAVSGVSWLYPLESADRARDPFVGGEQIDLDRLGHLPVRELDRLEGVASLRAPEMSIDAARATGVPGGVRGVARVNAHLRAALFEVRAVIGGVQDAEAVVVLEREDLQCVGWADLWRDEEIALTFAKCCCTIGLSQLSFIEHRVRGERTCIDFEL